MNIEFSVDFQLGETTVVINKFWQCRPDHSQGKYVSWKGDKLAGAEMSKGRDRIAVAVHNISVVQKLCKQIASDAKFTLCCFSVSPVGPTLL